MKKRELILLFSFFLIPTIYAQKVGLVLSGGGAKGITHIGIIKALEENNIPIDYITGTSMGAIIGGLYAMGYSTNQMVKVFKSDDFKNWSTGEVEPDYKFSYLHDSPKPYFVEIPFNFNKIDSINLKSFILPSNLISPRQMNYAFLPLTSQANALVGGNFDKLFVPFRCVASDIYNKKAIVFNQGNLGDAIRASMTFPFVFKPINVDGRLLFDGGIFNNFPVDIMRTDFKPDFILGSVVTDNPRKPDERDIVMQVQNMLMSKTDYSLTEDEGVLLKFELNNIKLLDFTKIDQLVQLGYDSTMKHIEEIKSRVNRRISTTEIANKRLFFQTQFPALKFQNIIVEGVDSLQESYVKQMFHAKNKIFTLEELKTAYFKLISDDKILEVMPKAIYNSETGLFDLLLNVKTQNHLTIKFGGNVSSSTSNQAYFGFSYQNLTKYSQSVNLDAQFGKVYNGLGLETRIEIPAQRNWFVKMSIIIHKFDYFEGNKLFYADNRLSNYRQNEVYGKISSGFTLTMKGRLEFGLKYGLLSDNYILNKESTNSRADESNFRIGSLFTKFESNTFDNYMYPTKGFLYAGSIQGFGSEESFQTETNPLLNIENIKESWIQTKAKYENYTELNNKITLGTYAEATYSNRSLLNNYMVSVIQAPAFRPTLHSRSVFNESFCANKYLAIGLKPIYNINNDFHLRGEAYWFLPYKTILSANDMSAYLSKPFAKSQFIAETSVVYNLKFATAAMFINYYSSSISNWNFGVNIGLLLFNPKFTE